MGQHCQKPDWDTGGTSMALVVEGPADTTGKARSEKRDSAHQRGSCSVVSWCFHMQMDPPVVPANILWPRTESLKEPAHCQGDRKVLQENIVAYQKASTGVDGD
jgi:hypothetical protein